MLLQQGVNALVLAAIYALFALGYALVFGVLDILNLAHAAIFTVGAVVALQAVIGWGWSFVPALLLALVVGGGAGWLLNAIAFAPLRARNSGYFAPLISSIAASVIIENIILGVFGPDPQGFPFGTFPDALIPVGSAIIRPVHLLTVALAVVCMVGLWWLLRATRFGRAIRAVAANPLAAQLVGVPVERIIALTFVLSSALGALAGVLFGLNFADSISFTMGDNMQLRGLSVIVLGGMDSIPGVVLGALILAGSEVFGVAAFSSNFRDAIAFGLLFLILLVRPSGLLGRRGLRAL